MARSLNSVVIIGTGSASFDGYVSGAGQLISNTLVLDNLRGLSVHAVFSGATTLAGVLSFQFSNLGTAGNASSLTGKSFAGYPFNPTNSTATMGWSKLSAYPDVTVSSFSGAQGLIYELGPINSRFFQLVWTPSAGTGNMLVVANAKNES